MSEPPMVHRPWPNTALYAACMSGTPFLSLTVTHHSAGARWIAAYAKTNA